MHLVRVWRRWPYSPAISWAVTTAGRLALEISIVLLTASFIFGLFMKMDDDKSTKTEQNSATDYGFFREKLFWLCTALCFFYEAVEASMMAG